jgi:hypothetical protein
MPGVTGVAPAPSQRAARAAAPQAGEGPAPNPQPADAGMKAVEPGAPTGAETDEELASLGYQSKRVQDRVRQLAIDRNFEKERADQLAAEIESLRGSQAQPRDAQGGPRPQEFSMSSIPVQPFSEVRDQLLGESSDFDDLDVDTVERLWPIIQRTARHETLQAMQAMQGVMSPLVRDRAIQERDAEWDGMSATLKAAGTSREELEPYVAQMVKRDPTRSVRDSIYQAMDMAGVDLLEALESARAPSGSEPPPNIAPSSGRGLPTSQSGRAAQAAAQSNAHGQREEPPYMGGGDAIQQLTSFWAQRREAGNIRSTSYYAQRS